MLRDGGMGELFVESVKPGGAAAAEGSIRPGDQIVVVNGIPATGMRSNDIAPHIVGPPLSWVELVIFRQGMQFSVRLQRGSTAVGSAVNPQRPVAAPAAARSPHKGSQRLGGEAVAGRNPRALAAEAAMKRQVLVL
jgi:C-terminal processing protease CtpA/Prc